MTNTHNAPPNGRHALPYGLAARLRDVTPIPNHPGRRRELREQLVDQQPSTAQLVERLRLAGHL